MIVAGDFNDVASPTERIRRSFGEPDVLPLRRSNCMKVLHHFADFDDFQNLVF